MARCRCRIGHIVFPFARFGWVVGWAALAMAFDRKLLASIQRTWNEGKRVTSRRRSKEIVDAGLLVDTQALEAEFRAPTDQLRCRTRLSGPGAWRASRPRATPITSQISWWGSDLPAGRGQRFGRGPTDSLRYTGDDDRLVHQAFFALFMQTSFAGQQGRSSPALISRGRRPRLLPATVRSQLPAQDAPSGVE
jgi:hypothetical protein